MTDLSRPNLGIATLQETGCRKVPQVAQIICVTTPPPPLGGGGVASVEKVEETKWSKKSEKSTWRTFIMSDRTHNTMTASPDLSTTKAEGVGSVEHLEAKQISRCKFPPELKKLATCIALPTSGPSKTLAGESNLLDPLVPSFMKRRSNHSIREAMATSRLRLVGKFLDRFWSSHTSPFPLTLGCRR